MTLQQRADAFNAAYAHFPASHLRVVQEQGRDVLYGIWKVGQDYRNRSPLYGAYPHGFLDRAWAIFPDFVGARVLHAFSGSLPPGPYLRLDRNPARQPDVLGDVCAPPFPSASFDLAFADPPYSKADAEEYGTPMIERRRATAGLASIVRPGGFLVWLDTTWPMHQKAEQRTVAQIFCVPEEWQEVADIGLVRSTNHRVRLVSIFERRADPIRLPSADREAFVCGAKP